LNSFRIIINAFYAVSFHYHPWGSFSTAVFCDRPIVTFFTPYISAAGSGQYS